MTITRIGLRVFAVAALAIAAAVPAGTPATGAPTAGNRPGQHVDAAHGASAVQPRTTSGRGGVLADQNGVCESFFDSGELCVSFATPSSGGSSVSDFFFGDCSFFDNTFLSPGPGQGQVVGGNLRYIANGDPWLTAVFYDGPNCTGNRAFLPPGFVIDGGGAVLPYVGFQWTS